MARLLRTALPDGVYHVTARGVAQAPIFLDDDDRLAFLHLLAIARQRFGWTVHALCLMGNHYHLVIETTRASLSAGLHWLNGRYAQEFNERHGRSGHLFGDRFASWLVETDEHLEVACQYVRDNPVRAGLCEGADDWRWSAVRRAA